MNLTKREESTITKAMNIIAEKGLSGETLTSSDATRKYLELKLAPEKAEQFLVLFLTNMHKVIACVVMFKGTIDGAAVYPREIVRAVIEHNAAAVILAHNHPSGDPEPSQADIAITKKIKAALNTIDVRVLDHIVVGRGSTVSLANRGLI